MKKLALIFTLIFTSILVFGQNWSVLQLEKANTAKAISFLTSVEKDAIKYINLARLYPQEFAKYEVTGYYGTAKYGDYLKNSPYITSLLNDLAKAVPSEALVFDQAAYDNAKCFATEQGLAGTEGHTRINCNKGNYAECCSYGMETGKDIVMQWLIDHNVASLGHRINCLNKSYKKIGLSVQYHKRWDKVAVADMIW
ncbi:CAP domain-containing protein [Pedobacter alpinus]|uniref:CAP domain-containing protein n=1 Tax=Pedobacter alpinus TaxID=1590643 RepID=A0ABW5TXD2_9SPHI